jgi:hypothetical protein
MDTAIKLLTNQRYLTAILSKHFKQVTVVPYSEFMTASTFNNANELIWLDLPTKGRWTNKKRQELIQSMCHLTQNTVTK